MSEIKWSDPTYFTDKHALSMTLRDYFAAKAMQALVARNGYNSHESLGMSAYDIADAMLKMREL